MKTLGRILSLVVAVAVTCLMAGGCGMSQIKNIKLVSAGVRYVVPTSMRSFDAMLTLGIDNPAMTFNVNGVDGTIRVDDVPFATFTAGDLTVVGKKILRYDLPCTITLEPGISLLDVLKLSTRHSLDGIKADIKLEVATSSGRIKAPLTYKDLDLAEFSE